MTTPDENMENIIKKLFKNNTNKYIFIYTPPKVGSTSLVSSLRISLGITFNVIHMHDEVMLHKLTGIHNISINDIIRYLSDIGKLIFVIDIYRSPIERKMSVYFAKLASLHFNTTDQLITNYSLNRIINRFNNIFPYIENDDYFFEKYDILNFSKINNTKNFDINKKYLFQKNHNIYYIKLRLCDSALWNNILGTIFKKNIVIIKDHETEQKSIGELYSKFKNEYRIPQNYLEEIKKDKYFKFYYSQEERNNYLQKWQNKITDNYISYTPTEYNIYYKITLENQISDAIEYNHYIDEGCYCKNCCIQRRTLFAKIQNGETDIQKIIHQK